MDSPAPGATRRVRAARLLVICAFVVAASSTVAAALAEWPGATIHIAGAAVLLMLVIGAIVLLGVRQLENFEALVKARVEKISGSRSMPPSTTCRRGC